MKIIGGEFKGRNIDMPRVTPSIRPTSDKVREALFNIIKDKVSGASVLDLFAGSGALGIEAFSRGAARVTFVDKNKRCTDIIKKNVSNLDGNTDNIKIFHSEAAKAIKKLNDSKMRFDLVFLDPPYYEDSLKKCLIYIDNYDILSRSALIICEHFKKDTVPAESGKITRIREYRYGDTVLSIYRRSGDEVGSISGDV